MKTSDYSYQNIRSGLSNFKLFALFILLSSAQLVISSIRSRLLIQGGGSCAPLYKYVLVSWGSNFLNCVAPSTLFGDVFRVKNLMNLEPNINKDNSVYVSIFSKVFSLISLFIIAFFSSFFTVETRGSFKEVSIMLVLLIFMILVLRENLLRRYSHRLFAALLRVNSSEFIKKRIQNFKIYMNHLLSDNYDFLKGLSLSLLIQVLNTASFLIIILFLNPMSLNKVIEIVFLIPIGIFAMALPVSISGFGIGHIAFSELLKTIEISNGADVFTIYFAFSYLFDLMGVFSFFLLLNSPRLPKQA